LAEDEAVRITSQVADALELAHGQKLIHRDVKPDNILLTRDGRAKLADLGLIKDLDAEGVLTRPRAWLGTITFMAPEQFGGAQFVDARCDVYGLAATLYYALTGVPPFPGRGNLTILEKKLKNDFLPPRRIVPSLRPAIDRIVCRALDSTPESRPSSCRELAELLTAARLAAASALEADGPPEPDPSERRSALRYPAGLDASCRLRRSSEGECRAEVQDLSLSGACLQLDRRVEAGAELSVELLDGMSGSGVSLSGRIRWVRQVAAGTWNVGCSFARELTEGELTILLGNCPPTSVMQTID
jgi:serine/threonine protein kinase